jgi:hypothetical protein
MLWGFSATIDLIYQSPPKSDSKGDREIFMVGQGEQLAKKTIEEIVREDEEELAGATQLARDANKGKRHNGYWRS